MSRVLRSGVIGPKKDVTLEITRECPLKCIFCSSNGGTPHPNELVIDQWVKLVDESIELGAQSFLISGGEPFCSSYLKELAYYIIQKKVELSIYTSGNSKKGNTLKPINLDDLRYLNQLGKIRMVISLEAANPLIHDRITLMKNSFNNTITTIKNCINIGLNVELHFVPIKINYKELPKVVDLADELGVEKVSVLRFVPQGRGYEIKNQIELNRNELLDLKRMFNELEKYNDFVRIGSPFNPFLLSKQYKCTAGVDRYTIMYNGLVVPCEAFKFIADIYSEEIDVRKNTLKNIVFNSKIFKEVYNIGKLSPKSECYNCEFLSECGGGCPAQKVLNQRLFMKDHYCMKLILQSPDNTQITF